MKAANPYLNFNGNTEDAFNFYRTVFGGEFLGMLRYRNFGDNAMQAPEGDLDKIAHVALPLGNTNILMGTDVLESLGQTLTVGNNVFFNLEADSDEEAERLFNALAAGGRIAMQLEKTEWAEKYGVCTDQFGVQWMGNYTGDVQFPGSGGS